MLGKKFYLHLELAPYQFHFGFHTAQVTVFSHLSRDDL